MMGGTAHLDMVIFNCLALRNIVGLASVRQGRMKQSGHELDLHKRLVVTVKLNYYLVLLLKYLTIIEYFNYF